MDFSDKIARYEEIERRGLLSQLPQEKQDMWAEYKRRQAKDSTVNNDTKNDGKQSYLEQMAGKVATLDRGLTFGLGRKALGAAWAAGAKLGDTLAGNDNAPDFWGRYHEFVDPVVEAQQQYAEEHPAEALTAEIAASIANPANKVGASYIGKGKSLADVAARASAVGGGVGSVAGAMNTEYAKDLFPNTAAGVGVGAAMGGILPVAANRAGAVYNAIKRITAPEASVAGKATGLGNIVKDNESVRALSRGIMADDAVAAQVLQEAPTEMGRLNEELTDILNKTTGRKLNIEGAKQNAYEAYKSYVAANADYPVYTTEEVKIPTKNQIDAYSAESNFNPNNYTKEQAIAKLRERAERAETSVFNDELTGQGERLGSEHFIKENNINNIRTINNTLNKPDITYSQIVKGKPHDYFVKKYDTIKHSFSDNELQKSFEEGNLFPEFDNDLSKAEKFDMFKKFAKEYEKHISEYKDGTLYGQPDLPKDFYAKLTDKQKNIMNDESFMGLLDYFDKRMSDKDLTELLDFVVLENGKFFNKFKTDARYVAGQLKKDATNNVSVSGRVMMPTGSGYIATSSQPMYNITQNGANVKQNVPNIKDIVGQLNEFKQNAMNKALAEGAAMSDYGAGSLDAVHKAQGVLNDMIENSFDKSVLGVKRPTTQTAELMGLKQVFTNMLEPSGVKSLDARIAKTKSLEYFYDMGYKFKPSEKKFEDLGIKTLRDKRAFLQGRLQAILDNVKDDKNLAKSIRADENTLKKLMPAKRFKELLSKTSEIDRQYTRLNKYIQLANRELDKPLAADRPMSERGESKLSYLGSLYDKANALMWQNANRRRAQALLNGGAQNPEVLAALERLAGRYNLGQITPYIAQLAAQNQ
jgi:hypothetical protein